MLGLDQPVQWERIAEAMTIMLPEEEDHSFGISFRITKG